MSRPWIVLKFGGTSVATAERWARIAERVRALGPDRRVWIVVSALAGVSDALERAARAAAAGERGTLRGVRDAHVKLITDLGLGDDAMRIVDPVLEQVRSWIRGVRLTGELSPRLEARILAAGELASSRLGVAALARHGVDAAWVDARDLLVSRPDPNEPEAKRFLAARIPTEQRPAAIDAAAAGRDVVLTQGFIARTPEGETCLLGRGGSDTSAALFAALADANELEIWTDVPGMFTADPRLVPAARLVRRLGYREAQELAALGAKVLHPRCLEPVRQTGIPLDVRSTVDPDVEGTRIEATSEVDPAVIAVTCRTGVTLLSISTLAMWEASGFLARLFAPFDELGVSVDLVGTSQASVSLTLDRLPGGTAGETFRRLLERLNPWCDVQVVHPCAVVSIVGRKMRAALPELGAAMSVFRERPVHLISDSAEDMALSFVVDEADARGLVVRLHDALFPAQGGDPRLGPTWEALRHPVSAPAGPEPWWRRERERLLRLAASADGPRYVYHRATVAARARALRNALSSVRGFYYSIKANAHPAVLETVAEAGFGVECVSAAEVRLAREVLGAGVAILFTPNFCPFDEYAEARAAGAQVVIDAPGPLVEPAAGLSGAEIGLRIDPGRGLGHHEKVRTAGPQAKFGLRPDELDAVRAAAAAADVRIVGLHAHVGSGIVDPGAWAETARSLARLAGDFPELRWLDVGGGLAVGAGGRGELDLAAVERRFAELVPDLGGLELWVEPGRFVVADAGVLLARVTQVRIKGDMRFIGIETGMNSLLRPALYGAWHAIHNLTRLDEPAAGYAHVVGPICESSDVLGRNRRLPDTRPGDVLLIEQAGAYGAVMASHYNLRPPAPEVVL